MEVNDLRVKSMRAWTLEIPLRQRQAFATRNLTDRLYLMLQVALEDGTTGLGFCYLGQGGARSVLAALEELFAPRILSRPFDSVEHLHDYLQADLLLHIRGGTLARVASAIDIACWDAAARRRDGTLRSLLGGGAVSEVDCYASGGYYVSQDPSECLEHLRSEMHFYKDSGFSAVKMKIGMFDSAIEEERLRTAREIMGDDVDIWLDASNSWSSVGEALAGMERLVQYRPYVLEEPFHPDQWENLARLAEALPVTVATGEQIGNEYEGIELADMKSIGVIQMDAAVCGGITSLIRICGRASATSKRIAPHWFHDLHGEIVAAYVPTGIVEYFTDYGPYNIDWVFTDRMEVKNGRLQLRNAAGHGISLDEARMAEYVVGSWASLQTTTFAG